MKKVYPVIITKTNDGWYAVYAPDIDRNTQGKDLAEAIEMAEDLICIHGIGLQDKGLTIPDPSTTEPEHKKGDIVSWIPVDFDYYRKANDTRAVRKDVTIPNWMAERAKIKGLNLSRVLQDALTNIVGTL